MVWNLRRVLISLLAAAVLAFAAWMLWPRSVGEAVNLKGREISVSIITSNPEGTGEQNQPAMDMEQSTIQAGSGQAALILELLDQCSYHLCWDTLADASSVSGLGQFQVYLYDTRDGDRELSVSSGTGKAFLNGQVVRIGYFGSGRAAQLCEDLSSIVRAS